MRLFKLYPPTLPKEVIDSARTEFAALGLDASEWLSWRTAFEAQYLSEHPVLCPSCGGHVHHDEALTQRGNMGNDAMARHIIACGDCRTVFSEYYGYPGVELATIQSVVRRAASPTS